MQRAMRRNIDNTLIHVEDPEQLIRVRRRSMAEQAEQVANKNLRITRDSDGEEYSEAEEMNIPDLYVPDLNNTPLQRAIQNGMALNDNTYTCDELTKQITRPKSKIHNLRDAMNWAESLDRQGCQRELNRQERSALRETTIRDETVNEMTIQEEINFMSGRNDGHFNSTMKGNSGRWHNSPNRNNSYHSSRDNSYNNGRDNSYNNGRDSSYHSDRNNSHYGNRNNSYQGQNNFHSDRSDRNSHNRNWNPRYNYSDNYDSRRRLNRYRHQPRDPKNNIRFEYNMKDKNIYSTLRNTVDQLKEHPQADRYKFKKMIPKVTGGHRNDEEVREDTIAEMKMEELQDILKEDVDLIFDALVLHDYIEEVDA